ncbi:phosphotransferase, partial [Streptomyces sp. Wh19]
MTHTEIEITAELVRDLLRDQHPDLADQPLKLGARGWDNQLWRLGDDLAVRLPWATQSADELLRKEHAWLPTLAPHLPLPVPVPQRLGEPSERFPRPWIVTTWVPGEPADRAPATRPAEAADTLAAFLTALHRPAPDGAPVGRGRGGPLAD